MILTKQIVVDDHGEPQAVMIPWQQFQEIEEMLGLDLDQNALDDLRAAKADREAGNTEAYIPLDEALKDV